MVTDSANIYKSTRQHLTRPAISRARFPDDLTDVRALFGAYAESIDVPFCRTDLEDELEHLPGPYADAGACVLLARADGAAVGCVALKPLGNGQVEMARLYVSPAARRSGLGRALVARALEEGTMRGHRRIVLHTMHHWEAARTLYSKLGFETVAPYANISDKNVVFLGCALGDAKGTENRT